MPCHTIGHFLFWYHHVTYRTPCHASGHLVIYRECYGFERAFFTFHSSFLLVSRLPRGREFNLKVSRASCWSSKHSLGPAIRINHNNPQKKYSGRFYFFYFILFFVFWNINTVLTEKHTISVTWNKTKITLQEARKRGKPEEASTGYHQEPHIISKLLIRFVLSRI